MEGAQGGSGAPAPFLTKTYEMVDDPSTNSIVSWSQMNNSFVVWNTPEFARDLLPKYFKHNNFSSFVRQLNTYGFRKIDPDKWEFGNEDFVRGQRDLLKKIHRRKPIHSHSLQNHGQGALTESVRQELEEDIDRLKNEKGLLLLELQRETQGAKGMTLQIQSLQERRQQMEHRQRQMRAGVAEFMQRPGYIPSLVQQSEIHNKKRRLPNGDFICEEAHTEQNQMVTYNAASIDRSDALLMLIINTEPFEKLESCINSWENFLHAVGQASGEEYSVEAASLHPYAAILTEMRASSGDTDISLRPQSPKLYSSSPPSKDMSSSPELAESTCYVENPVISSHQLNPLFRHKDLEIDVNLKPATAPEIESKDQEMRNSSSATPTGANDHFWEQFLTETPGSADAQEVQSERRDSGYKKSESKSSDHGRYWLHMKTVGMDNLTEQMGQLTPAEKT